jgi:hypothetical protein
MALRPHLSMGLPLSLASLMRFGEIVHLAYPEVNSTAVLQWKAAEGGWMSSKFDPNEFTFTASDGIRRRAILHGTGVDRLEHQCDNANRFIFYRIFSSAC